MKDTRDGSPEPIRVFRPKWQVCFDDGTVFPASFSGIHLGTFAGQKAAAGGTETSQQYKEAFKPEWDIIFIDDYVFEYCEWPEATIRFDVEDGMPEALDSVLNVAIDASALSIERHDVWYKKLRFILRNFPKVKRITVVATVLLDITSPQYMREPMYHMDIQNISVEDRSTHGILFGEDLMLFPQNPETLRPSDFAIRAWNDLSNHWPSWKKRKEDKTAPCLFMTATVYFRKEWISLDGEGGPGGPCRLGSRRVDVAGTLIRNEVKRQSTGTESGKQSKASKSTVNKQNSLSSQGKKKPKFLLSLKTRSSMPTLNSEATAPVGYI